MSLRPTTSSKTVYSYKCYHRYIDDIFCIWSGPLDSLKTFHEYLNSIIPELSFTIQYNMKEIPFLDTLVVKDDVGLLSLDLYGKPTDRNNLLHYSSCHPRATRNSLPRSQFTRVSRIVTDAAMRDVRLNAMSDKFKERQYPTRLLEREKIRATTPLSPAPPSRKIDRVPFVHTYHPCMPKVYSIIRKHWSLLSKAYPKIESFTIPALICTRRPTNIKDTVVRADVGSSHPSTTQRFLSTQHRGTFPCLCCVACYNLVVRTIMDLVVKSTRNDLIVTDNKDELWDVGTLLTAIPKPIKHTRNSRGLRLTLPMQLGTA
ncbi:unnamed protein product [Ranitomeya imitator]|uniref:Helix-turn-helix domain-containing protein n=1 Tax=Ranitomeya imitator TaxID=111125 RepID=A0ABN9LP36_9NEOB|nr:unnamed protein product [Ranitomeya imitator]